tara:strand:- start:73 stop:606 length:534 start_codon:yes stop_codon:yes gene_type:complete
MSQLKVDSIVPRGGLPSGANGGVIQTVYAAFDSAFSTTSTSGADTGLSATINMQSSSNKLLINCSAAWCSTSNVTYLYLADGSGNILQQPPARGSRGRYHWGTHYNGQTGNDDQFHLARETFHCLHSPGATGNFTVKLKMIITNSGHTGFLNRNSHDGDRINDPSAVSTLTLMEVSA